MKKSSTLWLLAFVLILCTRPTFGDDHAPVLLWPDGAPGAVGEQPADKPHLRIYPAPAEQNTRAAVMICPGGGYGVLATDHEGVQLARWFNRHGINAAVLKYRLGSRYQHPAPLQDAQRAIRYLRANAKRLKVDPQRVGVMGFSAGGHLASTAATQFEAGDPQADDPIEQVSSRPDFAILCYPVISMTKPFGHRGSRRNLLGDRADDEELAKQMSSELRVTEDTPPTFLFHTGEDAGVPVENSLAFYAALRKKNVPAELHVYQFGPHGVGMADGDPVVRRWLQQLHGWMQTSGWLADVERAEVRGSITLDGKPLRWGSITFIPEDKNAPVAWSMVSRGKYRVPAHRGAVVGRVRIEVRNLGSVEPNPTIEDLERIDGPSATVRVDGNELNLELTGRSELESLDVR